LEKESEKGDHLPEKEESRRWGVSGGREAGCESWEIWDLNSGYQTLFMKETNRM
jgi:hypothetical protein